MRGVQFPLDQASQQDYDKPHSFQASARNEYSRKMSWDTVVTEERSVM